MDMRSFGYALAKFAEVQGDAAPSWAKFLRPDVRDAFQKSVRYLARRGDDESVESHQPSESAYANEVESEGEQPVIDADPSRIVCTYCDAEIPNDRSFEVATSTGEQFGVCTECQQSIDANKQSYLDELEEVQNGGSSSRWFMIFGALLLFALVLFSVLSANTK